MPLPIKVVVVTMFGQDTGGRPGEFDTWIEQLPPLSLDDTEVMQNARALYVGYSAAQAPPAVVRGDDVSGSTGTFIQQTHERVDGVLDGWQGAVRDDRDGGYRDRTITDLSRKGRPRRYTAADGAADWQ
jgi:purine nucleoside permease